MVVFRDSPEAEEVLDLFLTGIVGYTLDMDGGRHV
jgi:hypothetical protein